MKATFLIGVLCGLPTATDVVAEPWAAAAADMPQQDAAGSQQPDPQSEIIVEVASGRRFTGEVDAHTDLNQLWLRRQHGSAVVLRPLRWDRVVRVHVAGEELSGEEFLGIVKRVRQTVPAPAPIATKQIVLRGAMAPAESAVGADMRSAAPPETPRVRSLAIEAALGRWGATVDADGLLVRVYPLDAAGSAVAVYGTLEVELIGRRTDTVDPEASFGRLGHWLLPVREADFGVDGAVYRLPFQSVDPEFDLAVARYGAVHARLSVPGQGTFEATESTVRLRPASLVRDEYQRATGRRFFPQETTSDGRH